MTDPGRTQPMVPDERPPLWRTGVIFVIGLPSGGTSCLAGILRALGGDLGNVLVPLGMPDGPLPGRRVGRGFDACECRDLISICSEYLPFGPPTTEPAGRIEPTMERFGQYLNTRMDRPGPQVAKYPSIQVILSHRLAQLFPFHMVAVDRPWDECLASWARRRRQQPIADLGRFFGLLAGHRSVLFATRRPLTRVPYHDLLERPAFWVDHLVRVCQLTPTDEQRERAVRWVDPHRRHIHPCRPS